jgi:hypothetical protein
MGSALVHDESGFTMVWLNATHPRLAAAASIPPHAELLKPFPPSPPSTVKHVPNDDDPPTSPPPKPLVVPAPPLPAAIVTAAPGVVRHTVSTYPPPPPPGPPREPALLPPPPPPPPHACTFTHVTPDGTVHCVVQLEAEPLPQDHVVVVSPETTVDPSNTSAFKVADDPPPPLTCVHVSFGLHK